VVELSSFARISYEDGDCEELEVAELRAALDPTAQAACAQRYAPSSPAKRSHKRSRW